MKKTKKLSAMLLASVITAGTVSSLSAGAIDITLDKDELAKKVEEGVDVRVIYDGTNEFNSLPRDYPEMLKKLGIKCKVFAPLSPFPL